MGMTGYFFLRRSNMDLLPSIVNASVFFEYPAESKVFMSLLILVNDSDDTKSYIRLSPVLLRIKAMPSVRELKYVTSITIHICSVSRRIGNSPL
jgi:hypothetical protein